MKSLITACVMLFALYAAQSAVAAMQTVMLSVPGMNCSVCPITVKKALLGVRGVSSVEASLENKQARVVFDDTQTSVKDLLAATEDAGYPATVGK